MSGYIFYTGKGSKKNGKHTTKNFLKIMNKDHKHSCKHHIITTSDPSCIQSKKIVNDFETPSYKKSKKECFSLISRHGKKTPNKKKLKSCKNMEKENKKWETSQAYKKWKKLFDKCFKATMNNKHKSCTLNQYINYSGAEYR